MMKMYLPLVDSDGFDDECPGDKIRRILAKLKEEVKQRPIDTTDTWGKEKVVSDAWVSLPPSL